MYYLEPWGVPKAIHHVCEKPDLLSDRQTDSGWGNKESQPMRLLEGSALPQGAVMRSLKSRPSSFLRVRISRCPTCLVTNASKGAAASSEVPRGCMIPAGHTVSSNTTPRGGVLQLQRRFLIPTQGWVSRWSSASQDHSGVTWGKGKGHPTWNLEMNMEITINYWRPVLVHSLHFTLASPQNTGQKYSQEATY